jgi:hypothetical protein
VETKAEQTLEQSLSPASVLALHEFSSRADRSTGISQPEDEQRWRHFVIVCHEQKDELSRALLLEWLREHDWEKDGEELEGGLLDELYESYRFGRALLRDFVDRS